MLSDSYINTVIAQANDMIPERVPMLCINGIEVDLMEAESHDIADLHTFSWTRVAALETLKQSELVAAATSTDAEGCIPFIFNRQPLFSTPLTPPPLPDFMTSSISPVTAVVDTAPIEIQGLITPIFGSALSNYGMFYTPESTASTVPCKREGSALEKAQSER